MNKEFLKMQKLAGLITESQVKEIMDDDKNVPLTPEVEKYIDEAIAELYKSLPKKEWEKLGPAGFWESDFPEGVWMHFDDEFPEALNVNQEVYDYIFKKVDEYDKQARVNEMEDNNGNDKFTIIDGIVGRDLYDNFINAVEAIQDATIGQAGIEPQDVYDYLTDSMLRDA